MNEIKPVYRYKTYKFSNWSCAENQPSFITEPFKFEILYPAAALEALQVENAKLKDQLNEVQHSSMDMFAAQAKRIAHQQFLIDSLMLEYCPDEMTEEQWENWKAHQRKVEL